MHLWLPLASAALSVSLALGWRRLFPRRPRTSALRDAFLAATGLTLPVAGWLAAGQHAPLYTPLLAPAGAFLGGLLVTAGTTGLVERNAPPSAAVREKVLAHHATGQFPCRPEPLTKRAFDLTAALLGLAVTLPFWPVIAFLVWFEEPGPVFFVKHSVGRAGVTFRQVKFRSMRYGAERLTGPVASPVDDPRTLRVGRWLRRWHVDELSELLNVVGGAMSLVGPRPLRTVLVQQHLEEVPGYAERHTVRPGIAGIAQIEKYHISPAERLRKDRVYIRCMCLALDLRLLWRAVVTTVQGRRERGPVPDRAGPRRER
jgi:lipopolysaccharide/colanic/teichoic acid biosynthesis glycosyltransferase